MSTFRTAGRAGLLALLFASASGAAFAQRTAAPDDRDARIQQLEALVSTLTDDVHTLSDEVNDLKRGQTSQIETLAALPPKPTTNVTIGAGRPTIASTDGKFTAALHGIMQFDVANYLQDSPGPVGASGTDFRRSGPALGASSTNAEAAHARQLKDGDVFRRARIGIDGVAFGDWDYKFVYDFAGSGTENAGQVYETWVQYSGLKPFHVRVGAFAPSFGMDDQASTNSMPFLERAASTDIARGLAAGDTRTGVALWANGDHWLASAALTGRTIGVISTATASATAQTYGDQLGFVGRFAGTPFHGPDWLIHFGVHGSYVLKPANINGPAANAPIPQTPNNRTITFSNTPELRVDGTRLINTGAIPARHAWTIGLEAAAQKANFLVQGEYENFGVERSDGTALNPVTNPRFSGYYVEGDWMITGETRKYNAQTGAFDAPPVAHPFSLSGGGWGAWELAFRYSDMNLNDHAGTPGTFVSSSSPNSTIRGGDEQNFTVGLNWYPNPVVRFMLDYQYVRIDRLSPATSANATSVWLLPAGAAGAQIGQNYSVIALRSQVAF